LALAGDGERWHHTSGVAAYAAHIAPSHHRQRWITLSAFAPAALGSLIRLRRVLIWFQTDFVALTSGYGLARVRRRRVDLDA
jgi:hypothetical protein